MISGIRWVSELIEIAGGEDCFAELGQHADAGSRIIADPREVVARAPDIIVGSWCGKRFKPDALRQRPGWDAIPAVRDGELHEIKSPDILQPGPAALTDGLRQLQGLISAWSSRS
jgi:iron complex transport system substrate-binding protein